MSAVPAAEQGVAEMLQVIREHFGDHVFITRCVAGVFGEDVEHAAQDALTVAAEQAFLDDTARVAELIVTHVGEEV